MRSQTYALNIFTKKYIILLLRAVNPNMNANLFQFEGAEKWYNKILSTFGFDPDRDIYARDILYGFRRNYELTPILSNVETNVNQCTHFLFFGAGPNLVKELSTLKTSISEVFAKIRIFLGKGSKLRKRSRYSKNRAIHLKDKDEVIKIAEEAQLDEEELLELRDKFQTLLDEFEELVKERNKQ